MAKVVFDNRVNSHVINHTTDGVVTSWTGITKMVLDLISINSVNSDVQLDTSVVGETTVVTFVVDGELIFNLGDQDIALGDYTVELSSVDGSSKVTQLIHPDREQLVFTISSTETIT